METSKNIEFSFRFGGFYNSIHSNLIDDTIESIGENSENIDYKGVYVSYSKIYLKAFNAWYNKEFGNDVKLEFVRLYSPLYYNFETDKIVCSIDNNNVAKIKSEILDDNNLYLEIDENSKSCDGFISYHNGVDNVLKDDCASLTYYFDVFSEKFNDDDFIYNEEFKDQLIDIIYDNLKGKKDDEC